MALIRCKQCQHEIAYGLMSTASCGLLLLPAVAMATASGVVGWMLLHWSAVLLAVPVFFLTLLAVDYIPHTVEWFAASFHRCPQCGGRRWSHPYTRGFGL